MSNQQETKLDKDLKTSIHEVNRMINRLGRLCRTQDADTCAQLDRAVKALVDARIELWRADGQI